MGKIEHITREEFLRKVVDYPSNPGRWNYLGDRPALIDFYATWCAPCRALAPVLEELADEYGDRMVIYKVDIDRESDLATAFGIRSVPSLLFIPQQGQPSMIAGSVPKGILREKIEELLFRTA